MQTLTCKKHRLMLFSMSCSEYYVYSSLNERGCCH